MAILKTITTTSPIVDADGVNAFGWLRVRPNAPFEYNDGSNNISVTDAIIECQIQDGAIYAVGGVVSADLSLAPNTGASNTPETYYIVDLELNGTTDRQYWRIASSTGGAGSVDVEYVDVPRVPGPDTGSSDTIAAHLAASNPHPQYLSRSDTVAYGGTTTGAASDGLGKIPRVNTSTGKFDTGVIPSGATITAATVSLADAGGYYPTDTAEAALQRLGTLSAVAGGSPASGDVIRYSGSAWAATSSVPMWYAGYSFVVSGSLTLNNSSPGKIGNCRIASSQHGSNVSFDWVSAGVIDVYVPTGTTLGDFTLHVTPSDSQFTVKLAYASSTKATITFTNTATSLAADSDFQISIYKVE